MKIARTQNASRNIIYGVILRIYQTIAPFIIRTALIHYLGIEYLGLNSLFNSVLQVLNLAELGVGSAMVFCMYRPIAEDDTDRICAIMRLYRLYYKIIGLVILGVGVLLIPVLPHLISSDVPQDVNLYVIYLLNLIATVVSYWLFAYKNSILNAHQRIDISSKVNLVMITVQYVIQYIILWKMHNYYWYLITVIIIQIITNLVIAYVANRMYPNYKPSGQLSVTEVRNINSKVRDLFTAKVGSVILNSADSIVISAFLGLTTLAIYNNYYYVISAIHNFIMIGFSAITAGIGNSLITESLEKNYKDFKQMIMLVSWILVVCVSCFLNLFEPFMEMWVGKENMLHLSVVILLCIYFYLVEINGILNVFKDAAGMWHEDRWRPLVVALINLILNLVLVQFIGIYGVIISTIVSLLFVGIPWVTRNLFKMLFKKSPKKFILMQIKTFGCAMLSASVTYFVCGCFSIVGIAELIIKVLITFVLSTAIYVICFWHSKDFKETYCFAKRIFRSILGRV